jgi:hypothetical protein
MYFGGVADECGDTDVSGNAGRLSTFSLAEFLLHTSCHPRHPTTSLQSHKLPHILASEDRERPALEVPWGRYRCGVGIDYSYHCAAKRVPISATECRSLTLSIPPTACTQCSAVRTRQERCARGADAKLAANVILNVGVNCAHRE